MHRAELEVCWERAVQHKPPGAIDPATLVKPMVDVTYVKVLKHRTVRLRFSDGSERVVDLTPFLWGAAFEEVNADDALFNKVRVDLEIGTITWPNGAGLDPDVLHGDYEPAYRARPTV